MLQGLDDSAGLSSFALELVQELLRHWMSAGSELRCLEQSVRYLCVTSDHSLSSFAPEEATRLCRQALGLIEGEPRLRPKIGFCMRRIGTAELLRSRLPEARTSLQESLVAMQGEKGPLDSRTAKSLHATLRWQSLRTYLRVSGLWGKRDRAAAKWVPPEWDDPGRLQLELLHAYEALARLYLLQQDIDRAHYCAQKMRRLGRRLSRACPSVRDADVLLATIAAANRTAS